MPLESLLQLVETLRGRIETHRDVLSQNEVLTRYALIDPLLKELGWDTSDPALVIPEYRSGSGSADYALIGGDGKPTMMVEAKKLGTRLRDPVLAQGINYCLMEGTNHFAVTDGALWEIYETHRPVPIDEKRMVEFDLMNQSPAEVCLKALALWRPSVESGAVVPGQEPVLGGHEDLQGTSTPKPPTQMVDQYEWYRLTDIRAAKGQKPVELLFPDNQRAELRNWRSSPVETVRWLTNKGLLSKTDCPIMGTHRATIRYMVHTEPYHSDGQRFTSETQVNGLYVERNDNLSALINKTKTIIQHVGRDPAEFKVRFG